MNETLISENSERSENHQLIANMVAGYASQDLDAIIPLFDEAAVYHDMQGFGPFGKTCRGRAEIRRHFSFYFKYLMPKHTYRDSIIFAEGDRAFASWTLVLGVNLPENKQFHIRGCDYFLIRDGLVLEKCAFIKINVLTYFAIIKFRVIEMFQVLISPVYKPSIS